MSVRHLGNCLLVEMLLLMASLRVVERLSDMRATFCRFRISYAYRYRDEGGKRMGLIGERERQE